MKQTVRVMSLLLTLALLISGCGDPAPPAARTIRIGVTLYDQYDTFISEMYNSFVEFAREKEREEAVTITILRENADNSQELQNSQVQTFIDSGCQVICVNTVDRMDASVIIDRAEAAGVPVIFFNRELVEEDLERNSLLYYVGAEAEESGRMQGEIVADLWNNSRERVDRNGDDILQYVMLEGQADHQDAVVRTEASIKTLTSQGIQVERLEDEIADWVRSQAETKMTQWLELHGEAIEVVLANNDDMALGAIDALKRVGIPSARWPVVVGIDGTAPGLRAVSLGELSGTVYNDGRGQAQGMLDLAYALSTGGELPPLTGGRYIRLPYRIITQDNVVEFLNEIGEETGESE